MSDKRPVSRVFNDDQVGLLFSALAAINIFLYGVAVIDKDTTKQE